MSASLSRLPVPRGSTGRRLQPGSVRMIRESGIVSLAIFLYFFVRGLMDSSGTIAEDHARVIIDVERRLGLFHEPAIQAWVLQHDWLVWTMNAIYMYGHWPVLIATLIWLVWKRPAQFPVYRRALLISGMVGLVVFVTFPMSPPRFLADLGFVDTVTVHMKAYRVLQPPAFTNQYASMPSLHVGWNLLMGIAIFRTTPHRFWRLFAVTMPLAMYLATILTANHFFIDGIMGSALALAGLVIAEHISTAAVPVDEEPEPSTMERGRELLEAA